MSFLLFKGNAVGYLKRRLVPASEIDLDDEGADRFEN